MVTARLGRLVYGALDPTAGAIASLYQLAADPRLNHRFEVHSGVADAESAAQLQAFFRALRARGEK
jgi:tRNA(adenine34) deaminase